MADHEPRNSRSECGTKGHQIFAEELLWRTDNLGKVHVGVHRRISVTGKVLGGAGETGGAVAFHERGHKAGRIAGVIGEAACTQYRVPVIP
jgi:hypothetical protein